MSCAATSTTAFGTFSQKWTGLTPGTLYYYRGYITNVAGTTYSTGGSFTTLSNPSISAITPSGGANSQQVSITSVTGANFVPGSTVYLKKAGQSNLYCSSFTFTNSNTLSNGTCYISGAMSGNWDVVVQNPDGGNATLPASFTISAACPNVTGANYATTQSCSYVGTINGLDGGNLTISAGTTLTINSGQTIVWNPGKTVTLQG